MGDGYLPGFIGRLILALGEKDVRTFSATRHAHYGAQAQYVTAMLDTWEAKLAPIIEAQYGWLLNDADLPPHVRTAIERSIAPTNDVDAVVSFLLSAFGVVANLGPLTQPSAQKSVNQQWRAHLEQPLSAEQMALSVVKGNLPYDLARQEAENTGVDANRFDYLVQNTGNAPGPGELGLMVRRGIIDRARFDHGVQQGLTKIEWADNLFALSAGPPGAGLAVQAAVQGHLTQAEATQIVSENGIAASNFGWMYETAGRPPGIQQMAELWNRGVISQAEFDQAVLESDVKNKYVGAMEQLRVYIPPVRTILAMLRAGAVNDQQATQLLVENGVRSSDIPGYIGEAHHTRAAATHELTAATIREAYAVGAIDRPGAVSHLTALGWSSADASFMLDVVDAQHALALHNQAVARVRSLYLAGKVSRNAASVDLDKLGTASAAKTQLLATWDIEKAAGVRTLTLAELQQALRRKLITPAAFSARVVALGYDPGDVDILTSLTAGQPTVAQTMTAYKEGIITLATFNGYLAERGFSAHDSAVLAAEALGVPPASGPV